MKFHFKSLKLKLKAIRGSPPAIILLKPPLIPPDAIILALNQSLLPKLFDFAEPSGRTSPVCPKDSILLEIRDDTKPLADAAPKACWEHYSLPQYLSLMFFGLQCRGRSVFIYKKFSISII